MTNLPFIQISAQSKKKKKKCVYADHTEFFITFCIKITTKEQD